MIIISNKPGQLGNLLFVYANFLAYGTEYHTRILNPSFYPYKSYFSATKGFSLSCNRFFYAGSYLVSRVLFRLSVRTKFIRVIALDWDEALDLEKSHALESTFCFVQGWLFRSEHLLAKHIGKIRAFFVPSDPLSLRLQDFFEKNFQDPRETIIGIHVRRGDYRTFENGRYYYSVDQYVTVIRQLQALFSDRQPHFLICSNEKIDLPPELRGPVKITAAPGHELLDMYSLARCHYIAGPPSTYSMWASVYGNKPLYMIKDPEASIMPDDFKTLLPVTAGE